MNPVLIKISNAANDYHVGQSLPLPMPQTLRRAARFMELPGSNGQLTLASRFSSHKLNVVPFQTTLFTLRVKPAPARLRLDLPPHVNRLTAA